jgi:hypothetical protein
MKTRGEPSPRGRPSNARAAKRRSAFALALAIVTLSARGRAEELASDTLGYARQLFAEATELEAQADFGAAEVKLKGAIAIKETPGLRFHLGHCQEKLGLLVAAAQNYARAAELIRAGARAPDVTPLLRLAQRRLDSRIVELELVVPADAAAVAELDGEILPASALGTPLRLDPGAHRVLVRAPGRADYRVELTLLAGERRKLGIFGEPRSEPEPAAPPLMTSSARAREAPGSRARERNPGVDSSPSVRTSLLIGEAVLALVGVGVGVGAAIVRGHAAHDLAQAELGSDASAPEVEARCAAHPNVPEECKALDDARDRYSNAVRVERAGFITAGAAAGLFGATWLLWPSPVKPLVALCPRPEGALLLARGSF